MDRQSIGVDRETNRQTKDRTIKLWMDGLLL